MDYPRVNLILPAIIILSLVTSAGDIHSIQPTTVLLLYGYGYDDVYIMHAMG